MKKLLIGFLLMLGNNAFAQQPIFATITGGDLYSFDLANCSRHFIGATGMGFGDIAFTTNGKLWGIAGGELFQINTQTAGITSIGHTGVAAVSLVGLNDTLLLAEAETKLYRINIHTAAAEFIGNVGYQAAGDLTWYDDDLYMVTSGGQIVKIVLNPTATAVLSVATIGSSIPDCEAAVTASFQDSYNSIVGFNGKDAVKICQVDGSYQVLCPDINIGGTPGAASMRLSTQSPKPDFCVKPTAIEAVHANNPLSIFPNPARNQLNIQSDSHEGFTFIIYNTSGQRIKSGVTPGKTNTIDISQLSNGLYSIEVRAKKGVERKTFVVTK